MIAYVKGTLAYTTETAAVVDTNGVGYLVNVSPYTLSRLPARGAVVQLFTFLEISEIAQALHGFLSQEEVRLFLLLIGVSGIGPKVASAVLGAMPPADLMMAILAEDAAALAKAPGVGKKTAERIVLELRDKMGEGRAAPTSVGFSSGSGAVSSKQDAMDALFALGYGRTEAMQAVLEVADDGMTADQIIKLSLKKLARG
jgi:Holliday junction DNA helicase RuvA